MSEPLRTAVWPSWPVIPPEGVDAVSAVLQSGHINYWTGAECKAFEREFASYVGVPYGLAVANGTLALELALRAAGVGPGDEVIVPSRTFIATAGAVVAVGAVPVIADIDPRTNAMTELTVAEVLTPRTKAVIPVHVGGYPAPVDRIVALAHQVGALVIEDCAQAHGATLEGQAVGSLGDIGCFSFCQDKIMPLGEGGMIVTADEQLFKNAWAYRDHGRSWDKAHGTTVGAASPEFKWLNDSFGTNARLGEMEGALGRVQLAHLDAYHELRSANAHRLAHHLMAIDGITPLLPDAAALERGTTHAFYRLYALLDVDRLKPDWTRERVIAEIIEAGVPAQYGSCALIGDEKAFERFVGAQQGTLPGAHRAHAGSICFYVHPTLGAAHMDQAGAVVAEVLGRALDGGRA